MYHPSQCRFSLSIVSENHSFRESVISAANSGRKSLLHFLHPMVWELQNKKKNPTKPSVVEIYYVYERKLLSLTHLRTITWEIDSMCKNKRYVYVSLLWTYTSGFVRRMRNYFSFKYVLYFNIISIILNNFVCIPKPPAAAQDIGKFPAFFFLYLNKTQNKTSLLWEVGQKMNPSFLVSCHLL